MDNKISVTRKHIEWLIGTLFGDGMYWHDDAPEEEKIMKILAKIGAFQIYGGSLMKDGIPIIFPFNGDVDDGTQDLGRDLTEKYKDMGFRAIGDPYGWPVLFKPKNNTHTIIIPRAIRGKRIFKPKILPIKDIVNIRFGAKLKTTPGSLEYFLDSQENAFPGVQRKDTARITNGMNLIEVYTPESYYYGPKTQEAYRQKFLPFLKGVIDKIVATNLKK